ncbi:hypothetical protein ACF0H5_000489 [Mactra antiquata]
MNMDNLSLIRSDLVSLACEYGLPECIQDSKVLFNKWMENAKNNPIDPILHSTVYCTAVAEGDEEEWNFVYEKYKVATVVDFSVFVQKVLGYSAGMEVEHLHLKVSSVV